MKIAFYGTAAGEGWPGVFCHCQLCQDARRLKGKNIRTRSQALVNDDLLLDLPPDNQLHSIQYGLDLSKVKTLLFTHSHSDHCYPYDLELLREPYSHSYNGVMQVYGNEHVEQLVVQACGTWNCLETYEYSALNRTGRGLGNTQWKTYFDVDYQNANSMSVYQWGNKKNGSIFGQDKLGNGPTGPQEKWALSSYVAFD